MLTCYASHTGSGHSDDFAIKMDTYGPFYGFDVRNTDCQGEPFTITPWSILSHTLYQLTTYYYSHLPSACLSIQ
jgi:hypothetical protein